MIICNIFLKIFIRDLEILNKFIELPYYLLQIFHNLLIFFKLRHLLNESFYFADFLK